LLQHACLLWIGFILYGAAAVLLHARTMVGILWVDGALIGIALIAYTMVQRSVSAALPPERIVVLLLCGLLAHHCHRFIPRRGGPITQVILTAEWTSASFLARGCETPISGYRDGIMYGTNRLDADNFEVLLDIDGNVPSSKTPSFDLHEVSYAGSVAPALLHRRAVELLYRPRQFRFLDEGCAPRMLGAP
jgi:hypothetical protein